MNSYVSVDTLKGSAVLDITGTVNDARYRQLIEAVSREVDRFTHREFYTVQESRYFDGPGGTLWLVGDYSFIGSGSILESGNEDGTYDTAWAGSGSGTTDWWASPYNASPTSTGQEAKPFTRLEVSRHSQGTQDVFTRGQRNFQIDGIWGYSNVTVSIGAGASASFDATATTLTQDGAAGDIQIGWTIQSGTERMYVTGAAGTSIVWITQDPSKKPWLCKPAYWQSERRADTHRKWDCLKVAKWSRSLRMVWITMCDR